MSKQKMVTTTKHIDILTVSKGTSKNKHRKSNEQPISKAYPVIDTDLARDNIENDLTSSDKQDLQKL